MPENKHYTLKNFHFDLPEELIPQYPAESREKSRLFILNKQKKEFSHKQFFQITDYLKKGDVLVINEVKVIHARMYFRRQSGALVEILLNQKLQSNRWLVICNRLKRLKPEEVLLSDTNSEISIKVISRKDDMLEIETCTEFTDEILKKIGHVPLPPYIKRNADILDNERYQTVYSKNGAAAAAPTAGLHFTNELLDELKKKGIIFAPLTLDVSWGTFQPVRDDDLSRHKMHTEFYDLPDSSAYEINKARREGRRIIAVGTTSLRVLESSFVNGENIPGKGSTDIFIYPPYRVESIDAIITNFHTPCSTLLMLVSAFAGYDLIMNAYKEAVEERYRFFSYGDAMFIF